MALPAEVPLTPRAAERLAREAAVQPFEPAARALTIDWGMTIHGRQLQRWSQALGSSLVARRDREVLAYQQQGVRPAPPANEPQLLVIALGRRACAGPGKGRPNGQPLGGRQGLHAHYLSARRRR